MIFRWIFSLPLNYSSYLFLHLSLVGPELAVWGEVRVGAHAMGALPDLVTCCAGFAVGSGCICVTVTQTSVSEKQPVVVSLFCLLLCRAKNRKCRLW